MRNISQHVTWHEGVHSETAIRKNIKNIPNDNELVNNTSDIIYYMYLIILTLC